MNKERYVDINSDALKELSTLPDDQPLQMLNYLKYNDVPDENGKLGRDIYKEYMQAAIPFLTKVNAEIIFKGKPIITLIGNNDEDLWDEILIVKYASKKDFLGMIMSEGYPAQIRRRALKDSMLIYCK